MKTHAALMVLVLLFVTGCSDSVRKKLAGRWTAESGEGALKMVTALEFKEGGEFTRLVTQNGRVLSQAMNGKWRLASDATGAGSVLADANKLILTYQVMEPKQLAGSGAAMDAPADKTEAWLVIISKDATFGGKETLRLAPVDGALAGTNYFFRATGKE